MEIDKSMRKESVWKLKLNATVDMVLKAVEDLSLPEPSVTMSFSDSEKGVTIDIDISKDKVLNLSGVLDSFNQVCLGVEPTLAEEGYAEPSRLQPSSQARSPVPSPQKKAAEPAPQKKVPALAKPTPVSVKKSPAKATTMQADENSQDIDLAAELDAIVKDARSKPVYVEGASKQPVKTQSPVRILAPMKPSTDLKGIVDELKPRKEIAFPPKFPKEEPEEEDEEEELAPAKKPMKPTKVAADEPTEWDPW
jgi:hypothetical protein